MYRADDYANTVTSLGSLRDKRVHTTVISTPDLTVRELDALYEKKALSARVVDRVVDDALRAPFQLKDTNASYDWSAVKSDLDTLDVLNQLGDSWRWARLYGGSICILNVDDATPIAKDLVPRNATRLRSLEIIESRYAAPDYYDKSFGSAAFRRPMTYDITSPLGKSGRVHSSRVIRFDGVKVPPTRLLERGGWGPSVLDRVWGELRSLGSVMGYAENIMHEISVMLVKMAGFREAVAEASETKEQLRAVFEEMRWAIDNLSMWILDSQDEVREQSRTVTGLKDLIQEFLAALVRATDMPRTVLLGEQPAGLNASPDSEIRAWYDHVASQRDKVLTPALSRVLEIMFQIRRNAGEEVPTEWTIEWDPLWQPTEQEQATTSLTRAQAATMLVSGQLAAQDEARAKLVREGEIQPLDDEDGLDLGT